MADKAVGVFCLICAAALAGVYVGQIIAQENRPRQTCIPEMPDGRKLMAYHLSESGPWRCVYTQVERTRKELMKPNPARRQG